MRKNFNRIINHNITDAGWLGPIQKSIIKFMKTKNYGDKNESDPLKDSSGPKTLSGAALFSTENLTPKEEEKLVEFLRFLRS